MSRILGEWREGKSSPNPGKCSAQPAGKPGGSDDLEHLRRSLPAIRFPQLLRTLPGARQAFFQAWRNLSGPMWFSNQNQILGRDQTASRWSAPSPGKRTRREDHALSHRPQMSSGRLFLNRVARQQSPSPRHRQPEHNIQSAVDPTKDDISTLPGTRHFYFALTRLTCRLDFEPRH